LAFTLIPSEGLGSLRNIGDLVAEMIDYLNIKIRVVPDLAQTQALAKIWPFL